MISGAELGRLALALSLLALSLLAFAPPACAQTGWGLAQLMQSLAQTRSATAHFTERQTAPVLSAPLISSGTLIYVAPDYLRKTTTAPAPEIFILDHDKITVSSANSDGTRLFSLNQDPRIAGLIEGIRGTLAGDLPGLQQFYTVSLSGGAADWQLQLVPKDQSLARFIRVITIDGSQNHVETIDTASADGGDTRMDIIGGEANDAP